MNRAVTVRPSPGAPLHHAAVSVVGLRGIVGHGARSVVVVRAMLVMVPNLLWLSWALLVVVLAFYDGARGVG